MRMSMIRARFAENLSKYFELEPFSAEIFLMGLFSVLDQILEKPMKECLEMVKISTDIRQALLDHKGRIYPVLEFILHYEDADWADVSRIMLLNKMRKNQAYDAYLEALDWHRKIITIK
jgi:EAL and modified HD-GYP domain-containing signal transduction protein